MKNILFFLGILLTLSVSASGEWASYYADKSVQILYRHEDCHDEINGIHQQKVLFKFVNLTGKTISISFTKELTYTGRPASSGDKGYTLTLKPGQSIEGDCTYKDKTFYAFAKHLNMDGTTLQKFDLKNISVTTIE